VSDDPEASGALDPERYDRGFERPSGDVTRSRSNATPRSLGPLPANG